MVEAWKANQVSVPFPPMGAIRKDLSHIKGVVIAGRMMSLPETSCTWAFDNLIGRMVEISSGPDSAALTLVTRIVLEAQFRKESVAWISAQDTVFFPPDLAATGVDLDALPVVRVERGMQAAKAADALLRSGGFAVVVLDLGDQASMSLPVQTRLVGLAKRYSSALIAITRKEERKPSLGSLVSLRGSCTRKRTAFDRFSCELKIIKDKKGGPGWSDVELCRGPDGLC